MQTTDRKQCIRAHRATCTGGLKKMTRGTSLVEVLTLPDTVTLPVTCHKIGPVGQLLDSYYVCINWPYSGPSSHNIATWKQWLRTEYLWQVTGKVTVSGKVTTSISRVFPKVVNRFSALGGSNLHTCLT